MSSDLQVQTSYGLWDAGRGAFHGPSLRRAMVGRGWTVDDFAHTTRLNSGSIRNALHGRRVHDATAIRIFQALEKRKPMQVAVDVATAVEADSSYAMWEGPQR